MYLTQTLHQAMQQEPDRILTVDGDRTRTVSETVARVAQLAGALQSLGVGSGDRVGMLGLNSDRYHDYLLGVPWADAVLNPVNHRWSPAEVSYALGESGTRVLLVDEHFTETAREMRTQCPTLESVVFYGNGTCPDDMLDGERLISEAVSVEDARRGGEDLFGIFYTGGTTGEPKGVMLSHDAVLMNVLGTLATGDWLSSQGRMLRVAPMFHLADICIGICGLFQGSTHVFVQSFTPEGVLRLLEEQRITDVLLVPTMLQMMVEHVDAAARDLAGVHHLLYGTSPMSESLLDRCKAIFPNAKFAQAYGMTELAPIATILRAVDHEDPVLCRSAGRAAPHAEVRIVDAGDEEVPRGTVGEIIVRGDHMMSGYWQRKEETATALRGGWMHTGDAGYMDDRGYVFVVDRIKDMIVSGGENVYSAEAENALMKHPAVVACAVIGVPDEQWGERVHAVVVAQPDVTLTIEDLREFCREHIAPYKAPRSMETVNALPLSGAGKILKRKLRDQYWPEKGRQVG